MSNNPFKFLDSYTRDDRDIFFGREREVEELYYRILDGNLLVVYGSSGTGKTSLLQCGLAKKFEEPDWMPVIVRRASNINASLKKMLQSLALVTLSEKNTLAQNIRSVYLDHFKPIYFIFDQFEELFIFGSNDEIESFADELQQALNAGLSCKFIFVIRSEYLENISRFEEKIPDFFNNRIRIEKMTRKNAMQVITGPCTVFDIAISENFPEKILDRLAGERSTVELTYLQVYLDKVYKKATAINALHPVFDDKLLEDTGYIEDVLAEFLDEQIAKTKSTEDTLAILKSFVSAEGTKKPISGGEALDFTRALGKNLAREIIEENLRRFIDLRILKDMDENGNFELRHDALAAEIFKKISSGEKEILEVREFLMNRFNDFQKRSLLLTESDLQYILPYEKKLFLNDEQKYFIEKSKRSARQKRYRRRNIALGITVALMFVLSGFTLFAMIQRNDALAQSKIAEQKTLEAINQKEIAERSKEIAMNASRQAMDAKSFAELQSRIAGEQKKIALEQAAHAKHESENAIFQQQIALQQEQVAVEKSKEALLQKLKADSAQSETNRLRLLALSQAIAFKSLQAKDDKQLSALLAYEAYQLSAANGGNTRDPELYAAMYESNKSSDLSFQPVILQSKSEIKSIGVADGGKKILLLGTDGTVNTYSEDDHHLQNSIHPFTRPSTLNTGYLGADGKSIIAAYDDNSIVFSNTGNNNSTPPLYGHSGLVRAAAFSNSDKLFATGGRDSTIIIWRNHTAEKKIHFSSRIRALAMNDDRSMIAAGCEDGQLYLLNLSSFVKTSIANGSPSRVQCVAYGSSGKYLACGYSNGSISVFGKNNVLIKNINENSGSIDFIAIDEDLKVLASVSGNRVIHLYNLDDLSLKPIMIKDISRPVVSIAVSPEGKLFVACTDNAVREYDMKPEHLQTLLLTHISRNLTADEWNTYIGSNEPYKKIKSNLD